MTRYHCVYGKRIDELGRVVYMHRLKNGGWVEHRLDDTAICGLDVRNEPHKYSDSFECVDFPLFFSRDALVWSDAEVGGIKTGNVHVKPQFVYRRNFVSDENL